MEGEIKHLSIRITGRVQGVFFRASAKGQADQMGVKGFVRNELNGEVYIEVEGEEDKLKRFLAWCRRGPGTACVENLDIHEDELKNFVSFEVKRDN